MGHDTEFLDYGWRLHGRLVTVLRDRSTELSRPERIPSFLTGYVSDLDTLKACLQCGACTATCGLAEEGSLVPWRQMTFVQLGLEAQLVQDAEIWHCYGCNDCSTRCPSGVQPGRIMAALRHVAIERFATPRFLPRLANGARLFWLTYLAAALLLAGVILAFGAFSPGAAPLRYGAMLPHLPLNLLFCGVSAAAAVALGLGVRRAWRSFSPPVDTPAGRRPTFAALRHAAADVLLHRRFSDCKSSRGPLLGHRAAFFGFAGLLVASGLAATALTVGLPYPFAFSHPVKIAANLSGLLLVAGAGRALWVRSAARVRSEPSPLFDWLFPANLLLIGLSGLALELLRAWELSAGYPLYFAHLVLVLVVFATLPCSKLAHAAYRLTALVARHQTAEDVRRASAQPTSRRSAPATSADAQAPVAPPDTPEALLHLSQAALAQLPDATLVTAYNRLRDASELHDRDRYFPNIKRLFGSALEREKDRREVRLLAEQSAGAEVPRWYREAAEQPCTWWIENHLVARHALKQSCMSCGLCTSVCTAAQYFDDYNPRCIVDAALSKDEDRLVALLRSDTLWLCGQCGSCKAQCPRGNNVMGLVSSLRTLAQLKGYHLDSVRGRQQYAARHLWAGNFWNRACSLYFRNAAGPHFPDFGPRHAQYVRTQEEQHARVGGHPDTDGFFGGRKVSVPTLRELRRCVELGGTLLLWERIEEHAQAQAKELGMGIDAYLEKVGREG